MVAVATESTVPPGPPGPGDPLPAALLAHHQQFVRFVRRHLQDPTLAADALQESYLKAIRHVGELRDEDRVLAWFYRILRQTITDVYRWRAVRQRRLVELPESFEALADAEERQDLCACLTALLPSLKPEQARLIHALDLAQQDPAELATQLGLTANALRVRHHRARQQLRQRLLATCRLCATHGCLDCHCQPPQKRSSPTP